MVKALKFLKEQEKACNDYLGAFTEQDLIDYEYDDELEAVKKCFIEAQEAIAELEEAMKHKTCEGCKHLDGVICKHDRGLYCVRQFEADYFVKDNA